MSRVLALANQKGGVGKTTTAVNLAACLAADGRSVLLIDLDPQANATSSLGLAAPAGRSVYEVVLDGKPPSSVELHVRDRLNLLPASADLAGAEVELATMGQDRETRLRNAIEPIRDTYEYILIDCPPSLGLLTLNALAAADGVVVPVQCEYLALEGLSRLLTTIERVRNRLNPRLRLFGLVMTMFDPRVNLARDVVREVQSHFPAAYKTVIPRSVRLSEAPSHGRPITEYDHASKGAQAYRQLAAEVVARE